MTSDSSANQMPALPAHDARRWAGTSWTCCSSAKWARRLLICATAPGSGICQILSDRSLSNMSRRDAVRWSPAKQVVGQPIPWPCKPPNPTAQSMLVFCCCSLLCNRRTLPTRAVASCVECSKQHASTRAAISRWQRWDWQHDTTHHPPNPSTRSLACSRVSGAAAVLGRPSSAPDETVCLASRLANWACDTVSAKNSNSYQLTSRRMVEETEALPGGK